MPDSRFFFVATTVAIGLAALVHATLTWPTGATLALFAGGALIAFLAEAVVIHRGLLDHHLGPTLLGAPVYVRFGWTGVVYVAFRVARLWADGWPLVPLAAVLATGFDLLLGHQGVAAAQWTYTDDLAGPRSREVPWWNYADWFVGRVLTCAVAVPVR